MTKKRKNNQWIKNIEYIFTEEELIDLMKQGYLTRVKKNNRFHYIKENCKDLFDYKDFKNKSTEVKP